MWQVSPGCYKVLTEDDSWITGMLTMEVGGSHARATAVWDPSCGPLRVSPPWDPPVWTPSVCGPLQLTPRWEASVRPQAHDLSVWTPSVCHRVTTPVRDHVTYPGA